MTRDFEVALDKAISRLEAGEAVEDCLARYPEHTGLLEPLLRMGAFSERALADVEPLSETASARGKQRLLAAAAQQRSLAAAAAAQHAPAAAQREPALLPKKRRGLFALPARGLAAAALTLLLLVLLGSGLAVVSADSLPGDLLYPVKLGAEQVRLFLTVDDEAREELVIGFGDERRAEAAAVLATGREVRIAFEGTLESFDDSLWTVGGLQVILHAQTLIEGKPVVGATVAVEGLSLGNGSLLAIRLRVKGTREMQGPTVTAPPMMTPHPTITPDPTKSSPKPDATEGHDPELTCTTCPTKTHKPEPTHTAYPTKTREPESTATPRPTKTHEPEPTHPPHPMATQAPEPSKPGHPPAAREPEPTHKSHSKKTPHH